MDTLTELAIKYGTDKWGKHHYTPVYYDLFKDKRNQVERILEIGVGEGAGLRMWRDFFPNAMIYGADIELMRIFWEDRIQVFLCDQSSKSELDSLIGLVGSDIDFVVDDGSHNPQDQVFTALTLLPLLKKGSVYVIEDVADMSILESLSKEYATNTVECGKRYDDRLVIIKK